MVPDNYSSVLSPYRQIILKKLVQHIKTAIVDPNYYFVDLC